MAADKAYTQIVVNLNRLRKQYATAIKESVDLEGAAKVRKSEQIKSISKLLSSEEARLMGYGKRRFADHVKECATSSEEVPHGRQG
jgi:hypothetical protein